MKEEEFNDFLRNRADSFELKPSSGSFDEVARKLNRKKKRRGVIFFILPLILLAGISVGYYFTTPADNAPQLSQNNGTTTPTVNNNPVKSAKPSIDASIEGENENAEKLTEQTPLVNTTQSINENATLSQSVNSKPANNYQAKKTTSTTMQKKKEVVKASVTATGSFIETETPIINKQEKTSEDVDNTNAIEKQNEAFETVKKKDQTETNSSNTAAIVEKATNDVPDPALDITPNGEDCALCGCLTKKWAVRAYYNPFRMNYYNGNFNVDSEAGSSSISAMPGQPFSYTKDFTREKLQGKFNLGVNLEYRLTKRLSIGSGIGFSKWSSEIGMWTVEYSKDIVNVYTLDSFGNYNITGQEERYSESVKDSNSYTNNVTSIQVPLYFTLSVLKKKRFSLDANMGIVANYIQNITTIKDFKQPTRVTLNSAAQPQDFYKALNVNLSAGIFANYTIGKCWGVYAGPRLGLAVTGIHKNNSFENSKPYNWGLETGIKLNF